MGCAGSKPEDGAGGGSGGAAAEGGDNAVEYFSPVDLTEQDLTMLPPIDLKTDSLDCSTNSLKALPDSIGDLKNLKHLDANANELTALPASIAQCTKMEKLYMYKNKIKEMPANLPPQLTEINFFNNQVRKLPASIGTLSCLEEVNFASNKLMMTADAMFTSWASVKVLNMYENNLVRFGSLAPLVALEELRLNGNNLEEMPALGSSHEALTIIEIHKNRIKTIPDEYFASTPALTRFSIWGNLLEALPSSICSCSDLLGLQVQENQLKELPGGQPWPSKLETLFLQSNPLVKLPEELKKCSAMRRCNVSGLALEASGSAVADALKQLCMKADGGIFWAPDGKKWNA